MNTTYQWMVRRGRLGLHLDGDSVELEVDPEGYDYCELTVRDAQEVAGLLTRFGREIWVNSPQDADHRQFVKVSPNNIYGWDTDAGLLHVSLTDNLDGIKVSLDNPGEKCRLSVGPIVEIVQVLEHLAGRFRSDRKWWQFWK